MLHKLPEKMMGVQQTVGKKGRQQEAMPPGRGTKIMKHCLPLCAEG